MYEDAQAKMLIASGQMRLGAVDYNPTVEENIDSRTALGRRLSGWSSPRLTWLRC